jgi:predicted small lipoprotein YifL
MEMKIKFFVVSLLILGMVSATTGCGYKTPPKPPEETKTPAEK